MIRSAVFTCTLPLLMLGSPALADPAAADSCAKNLSPAALRIYQAAAPDMRPNSDMKQLLTVKIIPMVMSGEMNRRTARTAAMAASSCLRTLEQPQGQTLERTASAGTPALQATPASTPAD